MSCVQNVVLDAKNCILLTMHALIQQLAFSNVTSYPYEQSPDCMIVLMRTFSGYCKCKRCLEETM